MAKRSFLPFGALLAFVFALGISSNALAGKPNFSVYSEVAITFGGQTYSFAGLQQSYAQTQDGGRIVLELTTVGTLDYSPRPEIAGNLEDYGNHWEVVGRVGRQTFTFTGTCASQTLSRSQSGIWVRHVFLNCTALTSDSSP